VDGQTKLVRQPVLEAKREERVCGNLSADPIPMVLFQREHCQIVLVVAKNLPVQVMRLFVRHYQQPQVVERIHPYEDLSPPWYYFS